MRKSWWLSPMIMAPLLFWAGCSPTELDGGEPFLVEGQDPGLPVPTYVRINKGGQASDAEFAVASAPKLGGAPLPIYLNRVGATLTGGSDDASQNRSSVVQEMGRRSATIPRYRGSDQNWAQVRDCVKDEFARFNVTVTDVRPAQAPYIMAMFGGNGSELGFSGGVGGVAPLDDYSCSVIDGAVVFIFSDVLGTGVNINCEVAAQEIAHAISLDHELLASDPMTYLSYNGHKVFQDQDARCGEYSARQCVCRRPSQNSVQTLGAKLGWAGSPPPPPPPPGDLMVSIKSPDDGATLPANSTIQIVATATSKAGVSKVELLWKYNGAVLGCPGNNCTQSGSTTYTFSLNVGSGERRFQVRATDAAGGIALTPERVIRLGSAPGTGPTIQVIEPKEGQTVRAGGSVRLTADVRSQAGVRSVSMTWSGPAGSMTSDLTSQGGTTWGLDLTISSSAPPGQRTITVRATDTQGRSATAPPVRLNLVR